MTTQDMVSKLWKLCHILRDDGITYHQYINELTCLLFLKLARETGVECHIPPDCRWNHLITKQGSDLKIFYSRLLQRLSQQCPPPVSSIYQGAVSHIDQPLHLERLIRGIHQLDWFPADPTDLGTLYEGLLEKNAQEKKSGPGQYFTPRALVRVLVDLMRPQLGERCYDPACGTFGFMIEAHRHIQQNLPTSPLTPEQLSFQGSQAFHGCELVQDTYRLALMNAVLHGLEGSVLWCDALSQSPSHPPYDLILSNPPFGSKTAGSSGTKQLQFLQHICRNLAPLGRAAVIVPDNVLFSQGEGEEVRCQLMDRYHLHTVLRLPPGLFYAYGVHSNVLFFTGEAQRFLPQQEIWFYDMRTCMPPVRKTSPLTSAHFLPFQQAYQSPNRHSVSNPRWGAISRQEIAQRGNCLDLGLQPDPAVLSYESLPPPAQQGQEALHHLLQATDLLTSVVKDLERLEVSHPWQSPMAPLE